MWMVTFSGMQDRLFCDALGRVGSGVDLGSAGEELIRQQTSSSKCIGDAEAFEPSCEPEGGVVAETRRGSDERQLVGCCARKPVQTRSPEICTGPACSLGALEHLRENVRV